MLSIALLTILIALVFVDINIARRIAEGRNTSRKGDLEQIVDGIYQYSLANDGALPVGLTSAYKIIGSDTGDCAMVCNGLTQSESQSSNLVGGSYSNTLWDEANSQIYLSPAGLTAGYGSYVSAVIDAETEVDWTGISWVPNAPYLKALPNNAASESVYQEGNADMSGNVLLLHLNESAGQVSDSSGGASVGNAVNVSYNIPGKLNSAIGFNGTNSTITIPNKASLQATNALTLEAWVFTNANKTAKIFQKGDWDGFGLYQDAWNGWSFGVSFQAGGGANVKWTSGVPIFNRWYHLVGTYDGSSLKLYVDGHLVGTNTGNGQIRVTTRVVALGSDAGSQKFFSGGIDEAAMYSRALSEQEIRAHYLRGAQRLKVQVRSCADELCSSESFVGPSGSASYYTELNNTANGLPGFDLTGIPTNRYFQFRVVFETDTATTSPKLADFQVTNSGGEIVTPGYTASSCIDLATELVPNYLAKMPIDPSGNSMNTLYAVAVKGNNRISVISCNAELEELLMVEK